MPDDIALLLLVRIIMSLPSDRKMSDFILL